jgi:DNA-directed RNA polymerase specialized sigma24 family protein
MAREERRIYKPPHIRTKQGAAPLPMLRIGVARDEESEPALDVADEHSAQDMDRVLTRVAQQPIRDAINKALAAIHAPEDCVILMARLIADPPQPYEAIAERLGAGWTAAAVRQRYRRARLQLQEILKDDADHWY